MSLKVRKPSFGIQLTTPTNGVKTIQAAQVFQDDIKEVSSIHSHDNTSINIDNDNNNDYDSTSSSCLSNNKICQNYMKNRRNKVIDLIIIIVFFFFLIGMLLVHLTDESPTFTPSYDDIETIWGYHDGVNVLIPNLWASIYTQCDSNTQQQLLVIIRKL